jgi:hypothetical protein
MKKAVGLTVLFAALLLVTGVAFADWCDCYEITCTDLDRPLMITHDVELCFDPYDSEGSFQGLCSVMRRAICPCFWA